MTTDVDNYSVDNEYDQVVIFPDFGNEGIGESYFVDDIVPAGGVSTKEVALTDASLKIYPNPVFNELTISFEAYISGDTEVIIFNSLGQRCSYQDLGKMSSGIQNHTLNVNKLSNGIYFLNLIVNGEFLTARKFIVEK